MAIKLDNATYNEKYNTELNMNKTKAILHNKALLSLLAKDINPEKIIVDQFASPRKYYEYLSEQPKKLTNIFFTPKAEDQSLAVACASIISRYIFLKEMAKLSQELGYDLPKGAGPIVDEVAQKIVQEKGFAYLKHIAKLNFKNTAKLKD